MHTRSQGAALRLGFTHEGIIRAHRVLAPGKEGIRSEPLYMDMARLHVLIVIQKDGLGRGRS